MFKTMMMMMMILLFCLASPSYPIFDPLPYYLPLPSFDSNDGSDIEGENPIQKFILGDKPQKEKIAVVVGEKDTVEKKLL